MYFAVLLFCFSFLLMRIRLPFEFCVQLRAACFIYFSFIYCVAFLMNTSEQNTRKKSRTTTKICTLTLLGVIGRDREC